METRTAQLNVRTTEKFRTEIENLSVNKGISKAEIIEKAVHDYVEVETRKEVEAAYTALNTRLDPFIKQHPEFNPVNVLLAVFHGLSPEAMTNLCDETQYDDFTFDKVVSAKVENARNKGSFERSKTKPRNPVKAATALSAIASDEMITAYTTT